MNRVSKNNIVFSSLVIWALLNSCFYQYIGLESSFVMIKNLDKLLIYAVVLYSIDQLDFRNNLYSTLIVYGIGITFVYNVAYWGTNPYNEITAYTQPLGPMGLFSYFFLKKLKADKRVVEQFLVLMTLIYLICWIIAIINIPHLVFGIDRDKDLLNVDRGFYRLWVPDKEHFPFIVFFLLGLYYNYKRSVYLILSLLGIVIVILHVGRQMIFWTIIMAIFFSYRQNKKNVTKILILIFVIIFAGWYVAETIPSFSILYDMTIEQTGQYDDDVRTQAIFYYIDKYPHNIFSFIFGNGVPAEGLLKRELLNAYSLHFYREDIGFVTMYIHFGLWMVVLMFLLLIHIIRLKVENKYLYLKFYIYYIYGSYIFSHTLTTDLFYVFCSFYILEVSSKRVKIINKLTYNNENKDSVRTYQLV